MSVAESWSRVMSLLREHASADHADLPGPATEQMLAAAEERMGISLHGDLRTWLLQNNLDLPKEDVDDEVACCGFDGFPDEGSFFLGIRAMEKLYANRSTSCGFDPRTSRTTRSGVTSGSRSCRTGTAGWESSSMRGTGASAAGSWVAPRLRASTNRWPSISTPWRRR